MSMLGPSGSMGAGPELLEITFDQLRTLLLVAETGSALRAARNAGIDVPKEKVDKCIEYVKRCQNPDGGFSYVAGQGPGSGFARSGAGVASLYYAGIFEGDNLKNGLNYLKQYLPG